MVGSYWRPNESVPSRSDCRPTQACRPNSRPPCLKAPLFTSKPFSRRNSARVPPPRSSEPAMPQRLPKVSPLFIWKVLCPFALLV